ncbi:unnamed protein product [Closterium sp. NIES-53]
MSRDLQSRRFSNRSNRSSRLPVYTDDDDDAAFEAWLREQEHEGAGGSSGRGGKTAKTGKADVKSGKADSKTSENRGGDKAKERRSERVKADASTAAGGAGGGKPDGAVTPAGKGREVGGSGGAGKGGEVGGSGGAGTGEGKARRGSEGEMEGLEGEGEEGKDQEAAKVEADVSGEAAEMDADVSEGEVEGDADVSGEEAEVAAEDDDVCEVCGGDGELLMCDACPAVYHLYCLHPPLSHVPEGAWFCPKCVSHIICNAIHVLALEYV